MAVVSCCIEIERIFHFAVEIPYTVEKMSQAKMTKLQQQQQQKWWNEKKSYVASELWQVKF